MIDYSSQEYLDPIIELMDQSGWKFTGIIDIEDYPWAGFVKNSNYLRKGRTVKNKGYMGLDIGFDPEVGKITLAVETNTDSFNNYLDTEDPEEIVAEANKEYSYFLETNGLSEAKQLLRNNGYRLIKEDTEDWDVNDMPAGLSRSQREDMIDKHHYGSTDPFRGMKRSLDNKVYNAQDYNSNVKTAKIDINNIIKIMKKDNWRCINQIPEDDSQRLYFTKHFKFGDNEGRVDIDFMPYYESGNEQWINFDGDVGTGNEQVKTWEDIPKFFKQEVEYEAEREGMM